MVAWWWLLIVFIAGGSVSVVVSARAERIAERQQDRQRRAGR